VDTVKPVEVHTVTGRCYELSTIELAVANPFAAVTTTSNTTGNSLTDSTEATGDCRFTLDIHQEFISGHPAVTQFGVTTATKKQLAASSSGTSVLNTATTAAAGSAVNHNNNNSSNSHNNSNSNNHNGRQRQFTATSSSNAKSAWEDSTTSTSTSTVAREVQEALKLPFHCAQSYIVIPATAAATTATGNYATTTSSTGSLRVTCLPFSPGTYRLTVMLKHERLGEFALQVVAVVDLPAAVGQPLQMTVTPTGTGTIAPLQRELRLPSKNAQLAAAVQILVERCVLFFTVPYYKYLSAVYRLVRKNVLIG
jgi:hypothetical protein